MKSLTAATVTPRRLVRFLCDPHSYRGHPGPIRLVQTHASWLVLTARRVYKVKKAVNFGFLDFSTLEKRRHFCEREILLNRRLCPGIHLGVLPISVNKGRLVFGHGDHIVEYAVEMRRLPERYFLLSRLARGEITRGDVDTLVEKLRSFYEVAESTRAITAWGRVAKLRISTNENFCQMADYIGSTITRPAFEAIREFTNGFYRHHRRLFAARVREHRIRDCHGDLHLEHIHLARGRLTIYDCIEFNDRFRYIDVASDAAFLAMDFDFRARSDLSRHFVMRLAAVLHDPGLLRLLDFYKCYRAFVRGKVESFHASAVGVSIVERREICILAERYLRLALSYAVGGSEPFVLIVMGRVGSGKSTLAQLLSREIGWKVFSSDPIRKKLAGVPLYARGGTIERRRLYGKSMTAQTYAELTRSALRDARQERGTVVDATFARRLQRDRIRRVLTRAGVAYCFVEACAPAAIRKHRLDGRSRSGVEISDARVEDLARLDRIFEAPLELQPGQYFRVKSGQAPEVVVASALKALVSRRLVR